MNEFDFLIFVALFKDAYAKCFGHALSNPMSETESKLYCTKVLDQTGLSIGWKSVKNYSIFILDGSPARQENPSVATLDTLARYVLGAPYTTELQRKNDESHYPYWFLYKEKFPQPKKKSTAKRWYIVTSVLSVVLIAFVLWMIYVRNTTCSKPGQFSDLFVHVDDTSLVNNGWVIKSKDTAYWDRRSEKPGELTLFTLNGDTWPDSLAQPEIKNLLLRKIPFDCFTTELHLDNFIPRQEWQQAGILLLEDTVLSGKSIRLSLAFNDNFGGRKMPDEIYVQAITSLGKGYKPEELAHKPLFYIDSIRDTPILLKNLENSALRIEKKDRKFRFLYSGGANQNGAFKEVATCEFDIKPKYIGIFAIKGFTKAAVMPVRVKFFNITDNPCN